MTSSSALASLDGDLITEQLAAMSDSDRRDVGYTVDELISDCQFNGYSCTTDNFTWSYNPTLGNCYTFNSGIDPLQELFVTSLAGYRHGDFYQLF
jgi:hypothetical protein